MANTLLKTKYFRLKSYLLLQLLIVISLIIILIFVSNNYIDSNLIYKLKEQREIVGLKQLQQLFRSAQSQSINLGKQVYLCPTLNGRKCINRWNAGVMIFTIEELDNFNIQVLDHNNYSMFSDPLLRMHFFGGNQSIQKLTFLPNGMLVNNGNFCIYSKLQSHKSHCLYFNQAGKVYIKSESLKK